MRKFSLKTRGNSQYKSKQSIRTVIIYMTVAFVLLISVREFIAMGTSILITPLYTVQQYIETSLDTIPTYIRERTALEKDIQSLKQEIASQQGIKTTLSFIEEENKELRTLLGITKTSSILASVVARPPLSPYDTMVIDKGAEEGIVSGAPVYYGSGIALGYVRVVYSHQSLITLFSSPHVQTTVYIYGPNIFTSAYGEGGGVIRLSIPQGINVASGDIVVLPSLNAHVLGRIDIVQSTPTEPEQHAYITSEIPIQSLHFVHVGTNSVSPITFEDAVRVVSETEKTLFTVPVPEGYVATSSNAMIYSTTTDQFLSTTTHSIE
jgi:cell shape-determining protein MreC